jgi:hypothetical protein
VYGRLIAVGTQNVGEKALVFARGKVISVDPLHDFSAFDPAESDKTWVCVVLTAAVSGFGIFALVTVVLYCFVLLLQFL